MKSPSPYPRQGRPRIEDENYPETREKNIKLPADFIKWFGQVAKMEGMTWHNAAREALLEWARKRSR